jgi:type II secretory ATPase GspE/PulE/Tfp pilus assembly ATPase PilB-like protein
MDIFDILQAAVSYGASDVHIVFLGGRLFFASTGR